MRRRRRRRRPTESEKQAGEREKEKAMAERGSVEATQTAKGCVDKMGSPFQKL
jgi:hypothetical protein